MTSLKPYLIRSIYQWILDNNLTPYLLVDAENKDAILPHQFIDDGKIVLNIKPAAVDALSLGNELIEFNARFSGKPMYVVAPVVAIMAIYAKENGKGMVFNPEDDETNESTPSPPEQTPPPNKPKLRVVK
ncbi:MAG: ClpXP protease specificity-enhancing factor [Methylococcales bacterium]|nr:ClpXP protease specificity-enhancing factor [Methylococcales bacterium]